MTQTIIVPDVHGRSFWREPLEKHIDECEHVVFLGDYLDPYGDEDEQVTRKQSMERLDEIIALKRANMDKITLLYGNHDAHYIWGAFGRSSRYDSSNAWHNRETFDKSKDIFQVAWDKVVGDKRYLLTHAGVCLSWFNRWKHIIGEELTADNLNKAFNPTAYSEYSSYRGWGGEKCGSPMWSDIRERFGKDDDESVEDIDGIFNIFGHTRITMPYISKNWACLDCQKVFALDDEGKITQID